MFYLQTKRKVDGSSQDDPMNFDESSSNTIICYMFSVEKTRPNTVERDWVYVRTVWIHLICVHVFANALALSLVISSK